MIVSVNSAEFNKRITKLKNLCTKKELESEIAIQALGQNDLLYLGLIRDDFKVTLEFRCDVIERGAGIISLQELVEAASATKNEDECTIEVKTGNSEANFWRMVVDKNKPLICSVEKANFVSLLDKSNLFSKKTFNDYSEFVDVRATSSALFFSSTNFSSIHVACLKAACKVRGQWFIPSKVITKLKLLTKTDFAEVIIQQAGSGLQLTLGDFQFYLFKYDMETLNVFEITKQYTRLLRETSDWETDLTVTQPDFETLKKNFESVGIKESEDGYIYEVTSKTQNDALKQFGYISLATE